MNIVGNPPIWSRHIQRRLTKTLFDILLLTEISMHRGQFSNTRHVIAVELENIGFDIIRDQDNFSCLTLNA